MAFDFTRVPTDAVAITPSDTADVNLVGVYVGGVGDLTVVTDRGNSALFQSVPAGTTIMIAIRKVMSTGTGATKITGFRV